MVEHGLELADAKIEIVLFAKKKRILTIIPTRKYLGLVLDSELTYWKKIWRTADKTHR